MIPYPCGHPRTDANTIVKPRKDRPVGVQRRCKTCWAARIRKTPSYTPVNRKKYDKRYATRTRTLGRPRKQAKTQ